jgi:hypothetical protein
VPAAEHIEGLTENAFGKKKDAPATKGDLTVVPLALNDYVKAVELKLAEVKAGIIKRMFIFWSGSITVIPVACLPF